MRDNKLKVVGLGFLKEVTTNSTIVWLGEVPTFRSNMSFPFSGPKGKPNKKRTEVEDKLSGSKRSASLLSACAGLLLVLNFLRIWKMLIFFVISRSL
jgi:hypothetical protein